ncbi:MAG: hypothetical protein MI974_05670 [Chitinophagales bacterium]|nr:hypothetical protein [Chitinophagales bacterium]
MKWRLFEQKVGKQIFSHRTEVDIDVLWTSIEGDVDRINRDKRKKRLGFWLFLWGGMIAASTCVWAVYKLGTLSAYQTSSLSAIEDHLPKGALSIENRHAEDIEEIMVPSLSDVSPTKLPNETNDYLEHTVEHKSTSPERETLSSMELSNRPDQSLEDTPNSFTSIDQGGNERLANANILAADINEFSTDNNAAHSEEATSELSYEIQSVKHWNTTLIPTRQTLLTSQKRKLEQPLIGLEGKLPLPYKKSNKSPWFLSIDGTIAFASRELAVQDKEDSLAILLREIRNDTETSLETVAFGFQAGRRLLGEKLELSTGIHYTQVNERFEYENTLSRVDSIYGIQFFVKTIDNKLDTIYGLVPDEETISTRKTYFNKFQLIDLPILVAYRFPLERIDLGVQAGIFANIRMRTEGHIFNTDHTEMDLSQAKIFKSSIGISYFLALPVEYAVSDQLSIAIAPSIRFFPQSFNEESYHLQQEYIVYGLKGSIKYYFGSR